jgi:hypothetical protein
VKRSRVLLLIAAPALVALVAATIVVARPNVGVLWASLRTRSSDPDRRKQAYEDLLKRSGPEAVVALVTAYERRPDEVEPFVVETIELLVQVEPSAREAPRLALDRLAASREATERQRFFALYLGDVLANARDDRESKDPATRREAEIALRSIVETGRIRYIVGNPPWGDGGLPRALAIMLGGVERVRVTPPADLLPFIDLPYEDLHQPRRALRALAALRGCSVHEHDDIIEVTRP